MDHPRSRGVYSCRTGALMTMGGSSPLARGLLRGPLAYMRGKRIIPARAGFTVCLTLFPKSSEDHPRSRGVYWASTRSNCAK